MLERMASYQLRQGTRVWQNGIISFLTLQCRCVKGARKLHSHSWGSETAFSGAPGVAEPFAKRATERTPAGSG